MEDFITALTYTWNSLSSLSRTFCNSIIFTDEMDSTFSDDAAAGAQRDVDPNVLTGKPCNLTFLL